MKDQKRGVLGITLLLLGMILCGCAHKVDQGIYHFDWVVKVIEPDSDERLPPGATTMTMARKDWNEETGRWEIMAYSVCYDLGDMEYEMSLMMRGFTDYVIGVGPVWPQEIEKTSHLRN